MEREELLSYIAETRPHLEVTDVLGWSKPKWLDYRMSGIGCSEIGTIMGTNKFSEPDILLAQKVGKIPSGITDNQPMFYGRVFEDIILDLWESYNPEDPSWETMSKNYESGIKVRRAVKPELYVKNPQYPFLFGGCDGIYEHEGDLGVLEVKTISKYVSDQYLHGIPVSYIYQVHGYMLAFDLDYTEIAMFMDGRELDVTPIERNDAIVDQIVNTVGDFWDRVVKAREIHMNGGDYSHLEYGPTDTKVYESFLKERFRAEGGLEAVPSDSVEWWVEKYLSMNDHVSKYEARKRFYSNKIKYYMGDAETMKCEAANIAWREGKRGRTFRVNKKK